MTIHDVVVIGLGISGLRVAQQLEARGVDWIGVEAQARVGGRTEQIRAGEGKFAFETGGEFLKPGQAVVREVLAELGVGALSVGGTGTHIYVDRGRQNKEDQKFDFDPRLQREYETTRRSLDLLAHQFDQDIRTAPSQLQPLDDVTVTQWLSGPPITDVVARRLGRDLTFGMAGTPDLVSLQAALAYQAAADVGLDRGYGEERIDGGGSAIVAGLHARLPQDRVRLHTVVERIDWDGDVATVTTDMGVHRARQVCLALSPALARRITFAPDIVAGIRAVATPWVQSYGLKAALFYATPWWREDGLSGFAEGDLTVSYTLDTSPADSSFGMLTLLVNEGAHGRLSAHHSAEELRALFEHDVATYLGDAQEPSLAFTHRAWRDNSFAAGCGSPLPPGVLTAVRPSWGKRQGPIVWAGTESAHVGWGSIEGALSSAHNAVCQLTDRMG